MDVEFLNILNTTTLLLNIWKWSYYLQYGGDGMVENNNNYYYFVISSSNKVASENMKTWEAKVCK